MMKGLTYDQSDGTFGVANGSFDCPLFVGSAGRAGGLNNPAAQCERNTGPLPQGVYRLRVVSHPRFADPAIKADPEEGTEMCGRSGFYIHGGLRSEGCILIQRVERNAIAALVRAGYNRLLVVP